MQTSIFAGTLYTGNAVLHDQVIQCENGKITAIRNGSRENARRWAENVSAGLMDIHINGGKHYHFTQSPDQSTIQDIVSAFESEGTAYTLPTIVSSPLDTIFKSIDAMKAYLEQYPGSGVLGIHLEGPFLNPVKRGAHLTEHLQKPTDAVLEQIISRGKGIVRMITIAPELFTSDQLNMLLQSGITVSAGHSNATYAEAQAAFDAGIKVVTHLFNAMSGVHHRDPGLVGACFLNEQVYAPVILDGFHCDFAAARLAYQIKKEKFFMISDALFIGKEIKEFEWGNFKARLSDGRYINNENKLAGADISLADAIRSSVRELPVSLQEAIEMASIRPAKALGLEKQFGSVAPGYPSVFTLFDNNLQNFSVLRL